MKLTLLIVDATDSNQFVSSWISPGGVQFRLLACGIQVNHVLAGGNPAELMDISFSLHALVVRWLAEGKRSPGLHIVPSNIREKVINLFLAGRV